MTTPSRRLSRFTRPRTVGGEVPRRARKQRKQNVENHSCLLVFDVDDVPADLGSATMNAHTHHGSVDAVRGPPRGLCREELPRTSLLWR